MPLSTQLNYASTNSVRSRGGMSAATSVTSDDDSPRASHVWQTLVLPDVRQLGSAHSGDRSVHVRFDSPHKATSKPWGMAQWREDFGWHRSLSATASSGMANHVSRTTVGEPVSSALPGDSLEAMSLAPHAVSPLDAQANLKHMLAQVAHDIRSPIAVAQQIVASLAERSQRLGHWTVEQTELLHEAQLRLTQANRWAEGILVQRSLEHGQPVNVRRRFYPQQWLHGVQPLLNSLAKQRGVRLLWIGWDRSLPRLYSDANQLSRVLLNLVENAIQASRPGSEVRVHVAWQTRVTQRMIITIEDDGRGLSRDLLQQINAVQNPAANSQPTRSGIGLGLTTAKTLVHALGGSLRAQHTSSGGTQFSLMLPVDNYHSLVHSWLQQSYAQPRQTLGSPQHQIAIHALRSAPAIKSPAMWNEIDLQLQQAASSDDLVYRVARDRWLWLSKCSLPSSVSLPPSLSVALRKLRDSDNAWNQPLECRQQQVFAWTPAVRAGLGSSAADTAGQPCVMRLTSIIAERIAELIGDHVPPIDDLQVAQTPMVVRQAGGGGQARLIRCDSTHWQRPAGPQLASSPAPAPLAAASIAETPCESFSGTLAELAQQWHSRQLRIDQIQTSVQPPRLGSSGPVASLSH